MTPIGVDHGVVVWVSDEVLHSAHPPRMVQEYLARQAGMRPWNIRVSLTDSASSWCTVWARSHKEAMEFVEESRP